MKLKSPLPNLFMPKNTIILLLKEVAETKKTITNTITKIGNRTGYSIITIKQFSKKIIY